MPGSADRLSVAEGAQRAGSAKWCGDFVKASTDGLLREAITQAREPHLCTVRALISNAATATATPHPSSRTRPTTTGRPKGVVRAFSCAFIRAGLRRLVITRTHPVMTQYLGLDVSCKMTALSVVNETAEGKAASEPEALGRWLASRLLRRVASAWRWGRGSMAVERP